MMKEPTIEKLKALRLTAFVAAYEAQCRDPTFTTMSFDERLGFLVDAEYDARDDKRLKTALRDAKLRVSSACIEGIDFPPTRALEKAVLKRLATGAWVREHETVIVSGATGTGKTYIACALAHDTCRKGHRALYRRVPRMFEELRLARAEGVMHKLLARFARADVLILDDFAMAPMTESERRDLLEIVEDRHGQRATILTSQLPPEKWHDYLGDPTVADAICDRLLHRSPRLVLKGPSRRKEPPEGVKT
jgi:DNA replication protein DnaC